MPLVQAGELGPLSRSDVCLKIRNLPDPLEEMDEFVIMNLGSPIFCETCPYIMLWGHGDSQGCEIHGKRHQIEGVTRGSSYDTNPNNAQKTKLSRA